jgi:integrase/recombinase XerC
MTTELILFPAGAPDARPTDALAPDDKVRRLLDDFLAGLNPNTLRTYRQGLADFASFVGVGAANQAAGILIAGGHGEANHLALAYRANMVERDLAANTVNSRLAALRSLVKLARTLGMIGWAIDVGNVKARPYRDTAGCGAAGYRRLLEHLDWRGDDPKTVRDRAIVRLLFERALRRS